MASYLPRIVDAQLSDAMRLATVVSLYGPAGVGKTTTARRRCASEVDYRSYLRQSPLTDDQRRDLLAGPRPRLFDEFTSRWEYPRDERGEVEAPSEPGQFLYTASSCYMDTPLWHANHAQVHAIRMRTLSLYESGHSSGAMSLRALFDEPTFTASGHAELDLEGFVIRLARGGWPGCQREDSAAALARNRAWLHKNLETRYLQRHYPDIFDIPFADTPFALYAQAAALACTRPVRLPQLEARVHALTVRASKDKREQALDLVSSIAHEARDNFVHEWQHPWIPQTNWPLLPDVVPAIHFADPSLIPAALNLGVEALFTKREAFALTLRSQAVHDLKIYAQALDARGVFQLRDRSSADHINAVIQLRDGRWIGCEVVEHSGAVDQAAADLARVASKVQSPPTALVIITPIGKAYTRPDGIHVLPLAMLGP